VLIALGGLTGVGKTAIADEIRTVAGIRPLETDRIRKTLAGLDPDVAAPAEPGEGIYTQSMTHATYKTLGREALGQLETGQAALAVGTFVARGQRDGLREVAANARVPFLFVRLTAAEEIVLKRLAARPPGMSDGNTAVYKVMAAREDPPTEIPEDQRFELDTTGAAPRALAERILECARGSRGGAV
jgi:predicted kinase